MAGFGLGIAFVGYWVMYYGITQVQGGNWGLLDLGLPSRWTPAKASQPTDAQLASGGGAGTGITGDIAAAANAAGKALLNPLGGL